MPERDLAERRRVLVLVHGDGGERPAGPEIRGWEIVRALASRSSVTAVAMVAEPTVREGVRVLPWSRRNIARELRRHDAIVGHSIPPYALTGASRCLCVADLYDPVELEVATVEGWRGRRRAALQRAHRRLQLRWADVVLGANDRQMEQIRRDLAASGRSVFPKELCVPMGVPPVPPVPSRSEMRLRDSFEAIGPHDPVVLWWGSIWRWLDATTAVEAVGALAARRPDLRLVITAGRRTGATTDSLNVTEEVRAMAAERGLLDRHVFFLDEWVPFEQRNSYLADADIGIALHADTPEAALAARARYMDYVWASLPMVLSSGDEVADRLGRAGAARLVPPRDATAVATAIDSLLEDRDRLEAARKACRDVAAELQWPALLAPLVECLEGAGPGKRRSLERTLRIAGQAGGFYTRRLLDYALAVG